MAGLVGLFLGVAIGAGGEGVSTTSGSPAATATATATADAPAKPEKTVTATPTVTKTVELPPPPPKPVMKGDGQYIVGTDVQPGSYRAPGGDLCYFARLSSFNSGDIIANGSGAGQKVTTIAASDKAFETTGCGEWTKVG